MDTKERGKEMAERIQRELNFYNGELPEDVKLVWQGYVSALLEWSLIEVSTYDKLLEMLSFIPRGPVYSIMVGEPGAHLKLESEKN